MVEVVWSAWVRREVQFAADMRDLCAWVCGWISVQAVWMEVVIGGAVQAAVVVVWVVVVGGCFRDWVGSEWDKVSVTNYLVVCDM